MMNSSLSMNRSNHRQVLECGSPLPLLNVARGPKAAERGLPRSKTRLRLPLAIPVHGPDARPMLEVEAPHEPCGSRRESASSEIRGSQSRLTSAATGFMGMASVTPEDYER
jgi:hypothetical protein